MVRRYGEHREAESERLHATGLDHTRSGAVGLLRDLQDLYLTFGQLPRGAYEIMIGRLETVVLDARDPQELARFYAELIGAKAVVEEPNWVTIEDGAGRRLSFQTSPQHRPPTFPDPAGSQQAHVDVLVDDVDAAERKVLELGATRVPDATDDKNFRVFRDPAGHTFCLVYG
ncbi:VOC family protein [Actinophytocola sp.]|uniref:VOC family protein n=1 Tax=Actinophytocola sp. TaxID=1872138 RepID=UPI002D7EADBE|nr:VOC family protein [Actinophytocola sp.]HET9137939.1 VOC family protein [Actinophytocola sp.]